MNLTRVRRISLLIPAVAVALAACAQPGGLEPSMTPAATRPVASSPVVSTVPPSTGAPVTGEVPAEILAGILADAAERTGVPEDAIEVVRAEAVTWSDGSLGCPEPGMLYTQALVDGFQVVVNADGEELDYRVGQGGSFRLCETGPPGG
jgi:hypothetical protein